jgi:hypothetical protein
MLLFISPKPPVHALDTKGSLQNQFIFAYKKAATRRVRIKVRIDPYRKMSRSFILGLLPIEWVHFDT